MPNADVQNLQDVTREAREALERAIAVADQTGEPDARREFDDARRHVLSVYGLINARQPLNLARYIDDLGEEEDDRWSLYRDLCDVFGLESNHDVDTLVRNYLASRDPELAQRITFDSEAGGFACYARTKGDLEAAVRLIETLAAR